MSEVEYKNIKKNYGSVEVLKDINLNIGNQKIVVILGPSGSGKTTLVKNILYPALLKSKGVFKEKPGQFDKVEGDLAEINSIEYIDQNPIGQSSMSNPATYINCLLYTSDAADE